MMSLMLRKLVVGPLKTNCYILASSDEAVVIDPGWEGERILSKIGNVKLKAIILTHGHFDHVTAASMLKEAKNARILMNKRDIYLLKSLRYQLSRFGIEKDVEIEPDEFIEDGDELKLGDSLITVIHTPGHTPGSICLLWEGKLFSGDTLFKGAFGRVDLPGGNYNDLVASMRKLLDLSDEVLVFPGHGDETTIGAERGMMTEITKNY
ncbi:MAG: MBL fold metallo-hydrolase [Thermoproteota archaeon]|nr:MAG: MBL fold metallo-hydrolase [Candidatus Korarchaeota archaeon]